MRLLQWFAILLVILVLSFSLSIAKESDEEKDDDTKLTSALASSLKFRNIGPALMSGRIGDIVVDPVKRSTWYIAVCSGNVWKTTNAGTTFEPIFDSYGSFSIGCLAIDPANRHVIWVGTGENNSQRSVAYGDGIYKSIDGGSAFEKMGLDSSEHIAKILIDPRDSDIIYVASQGPLWNAGGHRGVYKSTDGGQNWERILHISDNTGVTDLHFDPRNPDILYAAAYQRRRHTWTLLNGGPESGVYKTTDAGTSWNKINNGLPSVDKGRIGLAISPIDPDVIYAIVEAAQDKGGFFRSSDRGENWSKQSSYVSNSPQYYQEIFADPQVFDRIYSMDTWLKVSDDGGKNFERLGGKHKHVDDHALVFDPDDVDHLLVGCDGGLYETWDRGKNWDFKANLPITQFYKIAVDNDTPFYNIYGGTQDNATQGGPSRTTNRHGIRNADWYLTVGGDGFDPAIDPEDPNIVYSQSQYGGLIRHDRLTQNNVDIVPQPDEDDPPFRWNWNSALMISPHNYARLFYGAQFLFQSDDRGNSWKKISPDLTRNSDRNKLKIMDRIWSVDAVAKNRSTSFYGTIVSVSESPRQEGLIYTGSDDGLIHVTADGGNQWIKYEKFAKVPASSYVQDIEASLFDANTVYAVFDNHKQGDFKPYVVVSTDQGKNWKSISSDLPERGNVYTIAQDHLNPELLFVGTEFGVWYTNNSGKSWLKLSGGIPTIAIRDIELQRRENDLVAGSFGRGFFVLDNYSPLRYLNETELEKEAFILPIKTALQYIEVGVIGWGEKGSQGGSYYTAPNPPYGATFTWYLKESLETKQSLRRKAEKELAKDSADVPYPTWTSLKAEDREETPFVFLTIRDDQGHLVRILHGSSSSGLHQTTWDLRHPDYEPLEPGEETGSGPMALPGRYTVSLDKRVDGVLIELVPPVEFEVIPLGKGTISPNDNAQVLAFQKRTGDLKRAIISARSAARDASDLIELIKTTAEQTPALETSFWADTRNLELQLMNILEKINGDRTIRNRNEPDHYGLMSRVNNIIWGHWWSSAGPTVTHQRDYEIAAKQFEKVYSHLRQLLEIDLLKIQNRMDDLGAPWTPGRALPRWEP